ncbi:hypothetical protein ACIG47_03175 [Promicromonospora sp. NPDC052451]|uniref:hypothetical protein n=1 Tax=Promicromonospora sp. NPDC052451 TaxID=3364407 RepID=UPI0037C80FC9
MWRSIAAEKPARKELDLSESPTGLQQHETERLSLIRYQLLHAAQQASQPAPLNSLALGSMQDAVESMLGLVVERKRIPVPARGDFLQIFDSVAGVVTGEPSIAGFRSGAAAMNLARVNFKHHGNQAASMTIARHYQNSENLVNELSMRVFSISIDQVSLLLFVRDDSARGHLEASQSSWNDGNYQGAMDELRLAFDRVVRDYEGRKIRHSGQSLFSTKPAFMPSVFERRDAGKTVDSAFKWLENLDEWVKMLALGVDMRRYAFFNAHAPIAVYTLDGSAHLHRRDGIDFEESIFSRCFKFVVDTALAFAEDDFDFDAWSGRKSIRNVIAVAPSD